MTLALKQAEKQLKQYHDASDSLYLDWKSGDITKEEYRRLKGKIAGQIAQLEQNISYLKEEVQVMADGARVNRLFSRLITGALFIRSISSDSSSTNAICTCRAAKSASSSLSCRIECLLQVFLSVNVRQE